MIVCFLFVVVVVVVVGGGGVVWCGARSKETLLTSERNITRSISSVREEEEIMAPTASTLAAHNPQLNSLVQAFAGGAGGLLSMLLLYPLNNVSTRLQGLSFERGSVVEGGNGIIHVLVFLTSSQSNRRRREGRRV